MNDRAPRHLPLRELPLWRLLVALDDAERSQGPESETARILVRAVRDRLREREPEPGDQPHAR